MLNKFSDVYIRWNNRIEFGFRNIDKPLRFLQMGATGAMVLKIFGVTTNKSILIPSVMMIFVVAVAWGLSRTKLQSKMLKYDSERNKAWLELIDKINVLEIKIDELKW